MFAVAPQKFGRHILQQEYTVKGRWVQAGFRQVEGIPARVLQQTLDAILGDVEVVPAPFALEALQLEEQCVVVQQSQMFFTQRYLVLLG